MTRLPEHLRTKRGCERLKRLRGFANALRGRYPEPIYLCGSALLDMNTHPRDWDLRTSLNRSDFLRFFGDADEWVKQGQSGQWGKVRHRWSDEMVKQSKDGFLRTMLNIDFQVYPDFHARAYRYMPRLRLDTVWRPR